MEYFHQNNTFPRKICTLSHTILFLYERFLVKRFSTSYFYIIQVLSSCYSVISSSANFTEIFINRNKLKKLYHELSYITRVLRSVNDKPEEHSIFIIRSSFFAKYSFLGFTVCSPREKSKFLDFFCLNVHK